MLEALWAGLAAIFTWPAFGLLLLGTFIGFWIGLLPGVGGLVTLAVLLPFTFGMDPISAFALLIAVHAVNGTTGDITSILFGVPGEGSAAASVLDGHPMTKKGEAGRALGASLCSSMLGALVGAFVLAVSIPVVRPVILAFTSAELFALIILGLSFVGSLTGNSWLRGIAAAGLGLALSMVGMEPQRGIARYTFAQPYLWEGIPLVPVGIGLFAIPEIIDLAVRGTSITDKVNIKGGVLEGVKDCFRYWGVTLRCSMIGTIIGMIPGLGGGTAQWVAYGHAVQSAKTPEERANFGKGDVRGVIGPGAANNSKDGGDIIPTVAFGVPGSAGMAILMGGFITLGIIPGPEMLRTQLHVIFSMVWTLIVANVITVSVCFLFLHKLAALTTIRGSLIIPPILFFIFVGAFGANNHLADLVVMVAFGVLGYTMVLLEWPRPPVVLGLVLGPLAEHYLYMAVGAFGSGFLLRPLVIMIFLCAVAVLAYAVRQERKVAASPSRS
jgi:putative tricarboxylic transport membrane protein